MTHPTSSLSINSISIRQDAQGRYSLADLYRASGGANRRRPSLWMANKQTKALTNELKLEAGIPASNFGQANPVNTVRGHGITDTYVAKELVYAYAMWISPAFHLHVIRAYDAMVSGKIVQHEKYWFTKNPHWADILPLALDGLRCTAIGRRLGISPGRVSRAIRRMIEVGLIDPAKRIGARFKPSAASRQMRLPFFASWGHPVGGA